MFFLQVLTKNGKFKFFWLNRIISGRICVWFPQGKNNLTTTHTHKRKLHTERKKCTLKLTQIMCFLLT